MRFSLSDAVGQYRGVIFDLDGTLCDLPVDWQGVREELARYAEKLTGAQQPVVGIRQRLDEIERQFGPAALPAAFDIISKFESEAVDRAAPHEDRVTAAFACVERGQRLAICSANMASTVQSVLAMFDLTDGFECVVGGDTVRRRKPHPEGLCRIVSSWRLEPTEVAYIADGEHEVHTAAQIGLHMFQV